MTDLNELDGEPPIDVDRLERLSETASRRTTAREERRARRRGQHQPQPKTITLKLNLEGLGNLVLDEAEIHKLRAALYPPEDFDREVARIATEVVARILARDRD